MNGHARRRRRPAYPARYSAAGLFRRGLSHREWPPAGRPRPGQSGSGGVVRGAGVPGGHEPAEAKRLVPFRAVSPAARYPVLGALCHPRGGIVRHDAVVWGYARGAAARGVHIHQDTEVTGIDVAGGRVRGVRTASGDIATPVVLNATAGWSTLVAGMAGVRLPITTYPLQAAVTEPVKPFLPAVIVSGTLHVYVSQTDRGELVFGASVDEFTSYSMRGSLEFAEGLAGHVRQLMPALAKVRLLRQWAGLCYMTPDFSPTTAATSSLPFLVDFPYGTT